MSGVSLQIIQGVNWQVEVVEAEDHGVRFHAAQTRETSEGHDSISDGTADGHLHKRLQLQEVNQSEPVIRLIRDRVTFERIPVGEKHVA